MFNIVLIICFIVAYYYLKSADNLYMNEDMSQPHIRFLFNLDAFMCILSSLMIIVALFMKVKYNL